MVSYAYKPYLRLDVFIVYKFMSLNLITQST